MLPDASPSRKLQLLGTALWGWAIDRRTAFRMLDRYVELGGRSIDTATNYPIDQRKEHFGLALNWISEWISCNGEDQLTVLLKVGAKDNTGSSNADLSSAFLMDVCEKSGTRLGSALSCLAIHWDTRNDPRQIDATIGAIRAIRDSGLSIGFSGVQNPELYARLAPDLTTEWWVQVKENLITNDARDRYTRFFPRARYLAYGVNMGGVKDAPICARDSVSLRGINPPTQLVSRLKKYITEDHGLIPRPMSLPDLSLSFAYHNTAVSGVIFGPRNLSQLEQTMSFWHRIELESNGHESVLLQELRNEVQKWSQ